MRDSDETVAQSAISAAYQGGEEVDTALIRLVQDSSVAESLRVAAANQLRNRAPDLDEATEKRVTELTGGAGMYGGYGYGAAPYVH